MLSKKNRLQKTQDFQRIHKEGKHLKGSYGKLIISPNGDKPSKFGIVVSADKGDAAHRNRAKRKVRSVFREISKEIENGWDMFFVVWNVDFTFDQINKDIRKILKNAIPNNGTN